MDSSIKSLQTGSAFDHFDGNNVHLLDRWLPVGQWFHDRGAVGLDSYQKSFEGSISPSVKGRLRDGSNFEGINFASQDYLSLSAHPKLVQAVTETASRLGVHSAGSAALMGISSPSVSLEKELESFLGYNEVTLFPTGWTAGYGIVKMLVREGDHIVIDILAHACLQEGAQASGAKIHRVAHISIEAVKRKISRIRDEHPHAGILVVTETLFSMDSDSPDIAELQNLCRASGATLVVDCAHDLGCIGANGLGVFEENNIISNVDVLIGTFSKTFASIGGFVATQKSGFRTAMRACCGPQTFTNAMTPIQASVISSALNIVQSPEGAARRLKLMANSVYLRESLIESGFTVLGSPSAIVPVVVGESGKARSMTSEMIRRGAIVNLVEAPAVSRNQSRWRLQVMADHDKFSIDRFTDIAWQVKCLAD